MSERDVPGNRSTEEAIRAATRQTDQTTASKRPDRRMMLAAPSGTGGEDCEPIAVGVDDHHGNPEPDQPATP